MYLSLNSITKYLPKLKNINALDIGHALNSLGIEIDKIIQWDKLNTNVHIGKVIKCIPHPNADKLKVCTVEVGSEKFQIVCGASNVCADIFVITALNGASLAGFPFKIEAREIRGIKSNGMICSLKELGIDDAPYPDFQRNGIFIFENNLRLKESNVFKQLGLDGTFFQLSVPSNRNDLNSIYGICKELASYYQISILKIKNFQILDFKGPKAKLSNLIEAPSKFVNQYILIKVTGAKILPSSIEEKKQLLSYKHNSINNFVDLTNMVMLETGNPIHAYDANFFKDGKFIIKSSLLKKPINCLGHCKEVITNGLPVITNSDNQIAAIAGCVGALKSSINDQAKNIYIEIANWNCDILRKSHAGRNLLTSASKLFSKPIALAQTLNAYNLVIEKLTELKLKNKISNFKLVANIVNKNQEYKPIFLSIDKLDNYLGFAISYNKILQYLKYLHYTILEKNSDSIIVIAPLHRTDVEIDVDIIEDIIRLHGIDKIPSTAPRQNASSELIDTDINFENEIRNFLVNRNFGELKTYSLVSKEKNKDNFFKYSKPINIINYSSLERAELRLSLFGSFVEVLKYNLDRQQKSSMAFEISKIYHDHNLLKENVHLAIICTGTTISNVYQNIHNVADLFYLKAILQELCTKLNLSKLNYKNLQLNNDDNFHPYRYAEIICKDIKIGYIGDINRKLIDKLSSDAPICYLEINLSAWKKIENNFKIEYKPFPELPETSRDFAFVTDKNTNLNNISEDIIKICNQVLTNNKIDNAITKVKIFDIYNKLEEIDKISCAFNLKIAAFTPLTDLIIKNVEDKIIGDIIKKHKVILKSQYDELKNLHPKNSNVTRNN